MTSKDISVLFQQDLGSRTFVPVLSLSLWNCRQNVVKMLKQKLLIGWGVGYSGYFSSPGVKLKMGEV